MGVAAGHGAKKWKQEVMNVHAKVACKEAVDAMSVQNCCLHDDATRMAATRGVKTRPWLH